MARICETCPQDMTEYVDGVRLCFKCQHEQQQEKDQAAAARKVRAAGVQTAIARAPSTLLESTGDIGRPALHNDRFYLAREIERMGNCGAALKKQITNLKERASRQRELETAREEGRRQGLGEALKGDRHG